MLEINGPTYRACDGVTRRDFLRVGALGIGGLSLADILRCQAATGDVRPKSIIMVYLPGGPSHIDMYDLKPDAPAEVRGEFKPIRTNVPGLDVCELMPLHAKIADQFAVVQGVQTIDTHSADFLMRGVQGNPKRPVFGSVVSRMRGGLAPNGLPRYVALGGENGSDPADPSYLGTAHRPFTPGGAAAKNLTLAPGVNLDRLEDRKNLLRSLDTIRRDIDDDQHTLAGMDTFTARALNMIASPKVREAFDINKEPESLRKQYGPATRLLLALRLVQAGVSVVTVSVAGTVVPGGDWDTHGTNDGRTETNWQNLRRKLPVYDSAIHTLITDLHQRGLDKDVCVVVWGEFGRTPKINKDGGRDHWAPAGSVLFAGGGLKMGQSIGDTGPKAERSRGNAYNASSVLATCYHLLGIDPENTLADLSGRPMYLLDDRRKIEELI